MQDGFKIRQKKFKKLAVVKFTFSQISRNDVPISPCCFVNFCKQQERTKQEIITHAYKAIELVAVAVEIEVCLI